MVMYINTVGFSKVTGMVVLLNAACPDRTDDRKRPAGHKYNAYCKFHCM